MSVLNRLACAQGRRDEAPNRELARELAEREDRAGIGELAANLRPADQNARSDCLKTLYEVGYLRPDLTPHLQPPAVAAGVADDAGEFLPLLRDRNNLQTCPKDVPSTPKRWCGQ
jgi:hypothetical protein